jgi:nucleoside-diphosphate-sugar epimerase
MKVFLAGGSGAVGKRLVPVLIAAGHHVTASTRSTAKTDEIAALGATPVVLDALDRGEVMQAVMRAEPEVVIHQLTALAGATDFKHFDHEFELTNRLRTEGIDYLLGAAKAAGVRRLIAQSYGNWNYARTGEGLKTETDALDPAPPKNQQRSLQAIRYLESAVLGAAPVEGVVLRYGNFYGPGTSLSADGEITQLVRKRRLPIIGEGTGVWSFIHIDDVASAAVAAVERGAAGVYNIVDDEPAPVSCWLPDLAKAIGAKPPRHVPVWLGRLAAGEVGVSMMTQIHGSSNAKAKRELGWNPTYPTYREGFRDGLSVRAAANPGTTGSR